MPAREDELRGLHAELDAAIEREEAAEGPDAFPARLALAEADQRVRDATMEAAPSLLEVVAAARALLSGDLGDTKGIAAVVRLGDALARFDGGAR